MTGHCSILLLSTIFDHYGEPSVFYVIWLVLGGLTSLKMVRELEYERQHCELLFVSENRWVCTSPGHGT